MHLVYAPHLGGDVPRINRRTLLVYMADSSASGTVSVSGKENNMRGIGK